MGEEPTGIPGHVSGKEAARWFQKLVRDLGCRFEAEGDVTRIHLESSIVEVKDDPERGVILEATIQLPPSTGEDPRFYADGAGLALELVSRLSPGREVSYSLDESIPGYPFLRLVVGYDSLGEAYNDLARALKGLGRACREGGPGGGS